MTLFIWKDKLWRNGHAHFDTREKCFCCNETFQRIETKVINRTIRYRLSDDLNAIVPVHHSYCTGCNPDFTGPAPGSPIFRDELYDIADDGSIVVIKYLFTRRDRDCYSQIPYPLTQSQSIRFWLTRTVTQVKDTVLNAEERLYKRIFCMEDE